MLILIFAFGAIAEIVSAFSGRPLQGRGAVIGSLTAIGDIVYAAEFDDTSTTGYSMRSGRTVFRYPRGTYTPVVSDGRRLYLVGYSSITALQPFKYKRGLADRVVAR